MHNTRIAPSPTGPIHLGTIRTAYFNWLAAKATNGKFIVRIDDTDQLRSKEEYVDQIFNALSCLGLNWDDTFKQSSRKERYDEVAQQLIDNNLASGTPLKLNFDLTADLWEDSVSGEVKITDEDRNYIKNMVIRRSDGNYTYHFANVIDDHDYNINFVIRGQDHVSNTSRQIAVYKALNWNLPKYAHVGLIAQKNKPMSKRIGGFTFDEYKHYHPQALLNCLLRLGWSPTKDDKTTKIIDKDKAVKMFLTEGKMKANNANFDLAKLDSFDRKYKAMDK